MMLCHAHVQRADMHDASLYAELCRSYQARRCPERHCTCWQMSMSSTLMLGAGVMGAGDVRPLLLPKNRDRRPVDLPDIALLYNSTCRRTQLVRLRMFRGWVRTVGAAGLVGLFPDLEQVLLALQRLQMRR